MAVNVFLLFITHSVLLCTAASSLSGVGSVAHRQQYVLPGRGIRLGLLRVPRGGGAVVTKQQPVVHSTSATKERVVVEPSTKLAASNNWFPITKSEFPQFAAMSFMMFLFIYVFTTVRDTKDTLVVSNCGAEAIPWLKLYGVMPCAILFILGYSKLSNVFTSKSTLFHITLLPFFIFYTVFAFVLYPNRDAIHLLTIATGNTSPAMSLIRYWSFSLYFIASELWASAGVPLLFWTCANDVTMLSEAKRFYPLFAVVGNLAPIMSGKVMSTIVALQDSTDDVSFGQTLKYLALVKIAACLGICVLYRLVNNMAGSKLALLNGNPNKNVDGKHNTKTKPTLRESIVELSKSPELRSMATMVICYNACVELTEVLWKAILRTKFNNKSDYMSFMGKFSQTVGISAFVLQLFASSIIRISGWRYAALITPLSMAAMAVPFFASVALGDVKVPLATALIIGTTQNVISKITKYSLFDPCKEMAYIPLGPEAKVKGKAAVDVLGSRLGRSVGSATQQLLVLTAGGTILRCAPALGVLYLVAVLFWCDAVNVLSKIVETDAKKLK